MANIKNNYSDHIKFYLSKSSAPALLVDNIIGWENYEFDAARDSIYQGVLVQVTTKLGFTKEAKKYILDEFKIKGSIGSVGLLVERFIKINGVFKWVKDNLVYADFYSKEIEEGVLTINFASNNIIDKIQAYKDEDFLISTNKDFENKNIGYIEERNMFMKPRAVLSAVGLAYNSSNTMNTLIRSGYNAIKTRIVNEGPTRHSEVFYETSFNGFTSGDEISASMMFYDNTNAEDDNKLVDVNIVLSCDVSYRDTNVTAGDESIDIVKYKFDYDTGFYNEVSKTALDILTSNASNVSININYSEQITVEWDECLMLRVGQYVGLSNINLTLKISDEYEIGADPFAEPSYFYLLQDTIKHLLNICTGRKDILKSSLFKGGNLNDQEHGELGLIALMSGYQARGNGSIFGKEKGITLSLDKVIDSICNIFNLGVGVEIHKNKEHYVIEKIDYFFRREIIGSFENQITDVKRTENEKLYYKSIEVGFDKGGEYDESIGGEDEPNVKTTFTTPIFNVTNKYVKSSKIRADETGLEQSRRASSNEDSFSNDSDVWFLDLKIIPSGFEGKQYTQVDWQDRLQTIPTGIYSPETYHSMLFSPDKSLRRLAKSFNSGMYTNQTKSLTVSTNSSNNEMELHFIGDDEPILTGQNVLISDLDRPIFKNEIISFSHVYSDELRQMILGKTLVNVNGEERLVPNYYFKFQWINEDEEIERGYFLKYEYSDKPTFEFLIANEEIIK